MIVATFPGAVLEAASAAPGSRTVGGVAVPWNVPGRVSSGETVIFHPGSLDAGARPPTLRDHDRTRTIGRVADAADDGTRLRASAAISRTPLGDESLVLAGDGALMFSVGAEPTVYAYDDQGRLHVYAADWLELTLLPLGAFAGAVVTDVTAAYPEGGTMPPVSADVLDPELSDTPDDPEQPEQPEQPDDPEQLEIVQAGRVPLAATRAGRRTPARREVSLSEAAAIIYASRGGDPGAIRARDMLLAAQGPLFRGIEAALVDVTLVGADNVASGYRPAYQAELVDIIAWGTPLIDVLRQGDLLAGDYPNKTFTKWAKAPTVALQAAEKTAINSSPVSITPSTVPVQTWAGGNDISQQAIDLGSPSLVDDYVRAAGADYAKKIDTYACTTLLAAAQAVATLAGDSFITVIGKLIGGLSPATTPPGGLFVATSFDVYASLIGVPQTAGPAFWDGNVRFGQMLPETSNDAGLTIVCDPNLPARTYLAGHKQGATWYDVPGTPFTLRAVNVGLLGLDIAVYGYGALGIQYPGAFTKTTQP